MPSITFDDFLNICTHLDYNNRHSFAAGCGYKGKLNPVKIPARRLKVYEGLLNKEYPWATEQDILVCFPHVKILRRFVDDELLDTYIYKDKQITYDGSTNYLLTTWAEDGREYLKVEDAGK